MKAVKQLLLGNYLNNFKGNVHGAILASAYTTFRRMRSSLDALKFRTFFPGIWTLSPVLGFLPFLSFRYLISKLPNQRISMRLPSFIASESPLIISLTETSTSWREYCGNRWLSKSMSLERVTMKSINAIYVFCY